ncbi:MAG TPA: hypothetical protein VFW95_13090 [Candidatus Limnocylindria bacterium]|nr:hypothetical protein [Candidatus Limnocylindria bacterium]
MPPLEEWTVERQIAENELTAGNTYELKNMEVDRYVIYGEREYGINLVWSQDSNRDMFFAHGIGELQGTPVLYGERIAIGIADGGYLRYQVRDYGINLGWTNDRVLEWEVRGGTSGQPIPFAANRFSLYNRVAGDYVVYCERPYGINLRWSRDCSRFDEPALAATLPMGYRIPLGGGGTETSFGTVEFSGQRTSPAGGGNGAEISFTRSDQWEAPPGADFGLATVTVGNLATGTWRVTARAALWAASCDVELNSGINASVNFEERSNGCGRGFEFPLLRDRDLVAVRRVERFASDRAESGADR